MQYASLDIVITLILSSRVIVSTEWCCTDVVYE